MARVSIFPRFRSEKFLCVIKYRKKIFFYILDYRKNRSEPLTQKIEYKNFHAG